MEVYVLSFQRLKSILTAPLVTVLSPIVNKNSSTSFLFLCTYRHTEKLLPLMPSTSCVTMDLLPVLLPKLAAPVDRVLQLDGDNRDKGEPDEGSREE